MERFAAESSRGDYLAATSYRTKTSDSWNFKYYRYDVRGRVIKLWNIISGFDTLVTEYQYNSQDQITFYSHTGMEDVKTFRNTYDYAGRLVQVDYYTGAPDAPNPDYLNLAEYEYNPNSQISIQKFNDAFMNNEYSYNDRSWISAVDNSSKLFEYSNQYFKNGNVKSMEIRGDYSQNFATPSGLAFEYEYDRSNRLTKATNGENIFEVINTYDKDGNILSMERHGSTGIRIEAFNYIYYSGTNKLQRVSGGGTQYTYDASGNMISDALNKNVNIEYDHRNLIIELEHTKYILNDSLIFLTKYYYDEAGNRIRKMTYDTEDDSLKSDIIYSRDVSGRELAVYENNGIKQWNLFGLDNIGYMTGNDELRFYIKDHLGSVRVVTDNQSAVINCQDYDQWGYVLENRNYQSDESVYKFTSKERDEESRYDYSYARNYNSRIGIFNSSEPIPSSSFGWGSYVYCADNPLRIIDPTGEEWYYIYDDEKGGGNWEYFANTKSKDIWTGKYDINGNRAYENVQGYNELLFFQGSELQWLMESGERMKWTAVSGILDAEDRTQPELQKSKDQGPIPEGAYTVSPQETYSFKNEKDFREIPAWLWGYFSWGFYKTPITPIGGTETYGRTGFYIHGGLISGSKGCIDLTSQNQSFHQEFLKHSKTLILNVQYP